MRKNNFYTIIFQALIIILSIPINVFTTAYSENRFPKSSIILICIHTCVLIIIFIIFGFKKIKVTRNIFSDLFSVVVGNGILFIITIIAFVGNISYLWSIVILFNFPFYPLICLLREFVFSAFRYGVLECLFVCFSFVPTILIWFGLILKRKVLKSHRDGSTVLTKTK